MAEMQNPTVNLTLTLDQLNLALSILAKGKFDRVADLVIGLRQQAGEQLQRMQQQAQQQQAEGEIMPPLSNGHDKTARHAP